ncbi:metal-dependent transcriptional regulator [Halapricum hydrolyticum]|uniref:Metal-dependent transcriptional regulator n=1 Tax=Halapricum hydrolyticum TaxID=2979991 RepID=A0AAE3I9R7_9EURY|nr:metal-dependent transcriptional regulator [Halapricum hydrolyticum]MCU4717110.1 metal-dependent transcriptional regulator [Halapricum hydrolyticum]MCU4726037.1 metal-dependent transcriptional regulator [Halapricum hydrolyticum]
MSEYPPAIDTELPVSPGEGRYLCGLLYRTLLDEPPIGNGELAEYLGVSGASVSEMIDAFDEAGLVEYEPYRGATLTGDGERLAREILWRRCVVNRFFDRIGGIDLAAEQAYQIGCLLGEADVEALARQVDQPCRTRCLADNAEDCAELAV